MENTCKNSDYIINFGKHKGKSLGWISINDPSYLVWLVKENVMWINYRLFSGAQERSEDRYDRLQDASAEYAHEDWGDRD